LAGWLLSVGRPSEAAACGEEVGEGAPPSGVVEGEGEGVGVGAVVSAAGVGVGWGSGVGVGVIRGDAVAAGVAVGAGEGVLAGCAGAGGCCSHAAPARLIKAMGTMRYLFMPIIPTQYRAGYSSRDEKGHNSSIMQDRRAL
jgi:hypothetical protein